MLTSVLATVLKARKKKRWLRITGEAMTDTVSTLSTGRKIFSDVKYFITGTLPDQVKKILDDEGGEKINFFSDMVTHCIVGEQPRENDISDAKELYEVPAVTPYWVLLSTFCNKILPTRGFIYDRKQIFSHIVVTASEISNADFKAIWAMITFYGGKFKSNLDKTCTHLICGRPSGQKYEAALAHEGIKIVTPDWVVECIKSCLRIDETSFHPKYLIVPKPKDSTPPASGDLSTAQILGFADDVTPAATSTTQVTTSLVTEGPSSLSSTQALLEKLKQRMPWNRPSTLPPTSTATQQSFSQAPYSGLPQSKVISQQQGQTTQLQAIPNSSPTIQQQSNQQSIQIDRMSLDPQSRIIQQGPVWRAATGQTVRPQYALIQRDGSVVQAQTGNWSQFQLQQQRLQQQSPGKQTQQSQPTAQQNQSPQLQPQAQQLQQSTILQNTQIPGQPGGGAVAAGIQVQGAQTQRQITWTQQLQLQGPPKQVIQLDPQTHAQLSQMDPHQRTLFLQKIQRQRQIILQQRQLQLQQQQQRQISQGGQLNNQQAQQSLPSQQQQPSQPQPQQQQQQPSQGPQQQSLSVPMRQQQIIIRGVMPPGLTPQQQAVWLHQQQFIRQQQILVQQGGQIRQPVAGSQQRIVQQQTATSTWIPQQADNQQQQQQLQLQRQQQMRIQQLQIQKQQQIVVQRAAPSVPQQFQQASNQQGLTGTQPVTQNLHTDESVMHSQTTGAVGGGLLVNNRTKTALANMLSSRLQTGHLSPQAQAMGQSDGSAAGQLRLMSAQQRNPQPPPPPPPPPPPLPPPPSQNQLAESQSGLYPQQRRTLGSITNSGSAARSGIASRDAPPAATSIPVPKSPARTTLTACATTSGAPVSQKPQFFAHNPSLRIPPDKYFLGCVFFFVEYDRSYENDLEAWEEIIRNHGGEVESSYTHRVTHVLCETQKHGIVQQALRDGKRCITAFWLNDVVLRGSLSVPCLALHFPVPFGREKPLSKYHMTLTGFEDKSERERVATMIQIAGGQYRNYLSPLTHIVVCRKAEGAKYKKAKETNKVTVNVQWLNEVLFGHYTCIQQPDLHKYQQYNLSTCFRVDYSLIPHLMGAWKLPINVTSEVYNAVKNSPPALRKCKKPRLEPTLEQIRDLESKILEPVQVINIENCALENRPHVLITGDKNFEIAKKAKEMGCLLAKNNSKLTHLIVCGTPMRTLKMLKGLILAKYVVKDSWLIDSSAQNRLLNESPYMINQVDSEDFKCNISKVVAAPDRLNLFKDKIFYMTPNVEPNRNALGELIILCGGQVEKQRRSIKAIQELNKTTPTYIVISCYNDLALIADVFRAKLEFYSAEFIMKAITTQAIDYVSSVYRY